MQHRPPAAELVQFTRKFLGLFMINRFDILMFLEDAGSLLPSHADSFHLCLCWDSVWAEDC